MATQGLLYEEESVTKEDIETLNQSNFDYVRFSFVDINGFSRSKTIPKQHVKEFIPNGISIFAAALVIGINGDPITLEEIKETRLGNMLIRPMPGTVSWLPWASANEKIKIGEFLCETFWAKPYKDGARQSMCPRFMARKQLDRLQELGYDLYSAFEAEFCMFEKDLETPLFSDNILFSSLLMNRHGDLFYEMEQHLRDSGVDVLFLHPEYSRGQFEMALNPTFGISAPDNMIRFKDCVKTVSYRHHKIATFMTKPISAPGTSGMHFNHSLWSKDRQQNVFYQPNDPDGLSKVAKSWIAGLVKHSQAITALCSPTVNCYRRLHDLSVPSKANWGIDDRCSSYRVKNQDPKETYVENRLPSSAANPYLVLAATLSAGLDGLVNNLECPPPGQTEEAAQLPKSLEQALEYLEQDEIIVAALGDEFVRWFGELKRQTEIQKTKEFDFSSQEAFEKEKELYFELI